MGVDFEQEIREIFGTTDLTALREISKAANEYQHMVEKSVRKQASGRKNSFTEPQIARILALQSQGEKITSIAEAVSGFTADDLQPDPACTSV